MEYFERQYPLFSLCGLNCGLCPMYHTNGSSKCSGCGGKDFYKNRSCAVVNCMRRHGALEYCYQCEEFPCKKYEGTDEFDSFITHRNQFKDLEKIKSMGPSAYRAELDEKVAILEELLANYNDGRCKNFFCLAVNLLELDDVKQVMTEIAAETAAGAWTLKEKATTAVRLFQAMADEHGIVLKLNKKKKK